MHASRVNEARAQLDDAERALRDDDTIALDLPDTNVPAGRTVFLGEGLQVSLGGRKLFADNGIDLTIRGPERIALTGPNGAGKSTLLRLINGDLHRTRDTVRADGRIAYLSQRLDLLDPDRTVARTSPPSPRADPTRRMNLLARFLFRGARIHLPVAALSGGERLRATLAACCPPNPLRTCCCSTSRPTTSTWSASASWRQRSSLRRRVRGGQPRRAVPRPDRRPPLAPAIGGPIGEHVVRPDPRRLRPNE